MHSTDVDYVSKRENVQHIAQAFNVEAIYNDPLYLPSIAICSLVDKDTRTIKEFEGRLFSNPDEEYKSNLVDIIDRPAGFESDDFDGDKLLLNTEMFQTDPNSADVSANHDFVRVINPVACPRSRLANIKKNIKLDVEVEIHRIK